MDREQQKTKEGESAKEPLKKKIRKNSRTKNEVPAGKKITIRLYPDKQKKELLMKWLGTARWTYNKCLDAITKGKVGRSETTLRALWLNSKPLSEKSVHWVLETPYDVRNQAMNDLLKAFGSFFAKGKQFQIKHLTRKDKQQSIVIETKH
jgi:transposase